MKRKIQQPLQLTLRRMMSARCNYRMYSRTTRPNSEYVANRYVLKKEKLEPTIGVIEKGSKKQRNPSAPTFWERSIECTLRMVEKAKKSAWTLQKNVYTIPGSYSENRQWLFKPSPATNVSSLPVRTSKERESLWWSQELHFVWWVKVVWLQKSNKRFENQRIHQLLWLQMVRHDRRSNCMCLWFGHVWWSPIIERITPSRVGENIESGNSCHIFLVVPGVQSNRRIANPALGDQKQTRAVGDHELQVETVIPEWLQPPTEGLTGRSSSSTDDSPADVEIAGISSFHTSSSETSFEQSREEAQ